MAGDAAAPGEELSESTTQEKRPEPAEVDEAEGESGEADDAKSEEADDAANVDTEETGGVDADEAHVQSDEEAPAKSGMSEVRLATITGLVVVVALAALMGWLGFRAYQSYQAEQQRELFRQVAQQGAINLTTIDWREAEVDIQRILDSATGTFYDDFQHRSQPFIEVVKKAQSRSEGTITEAAMESDSGDQAQVLVAVSVKTSTADGAEEKPRAWRMRITVQKVGDQAKVSDVEFVP